MILLDPTFFVLLVAMVNRLEISSDFPFHTTYNMLVMVCMSFPPRIHMDIHNSLYNLCVSQYSRSTLYPPLLKACVNAPVSCFSHRAQITILSLSWQLQGMIVIPTATMTNPTCFYPIIHIS